MKNLIIQAEDITLVEKDIVTVKDIKGFKKISKEVFDNKSPIFDLNGAYYLIGTEVAYVHNVQKVQDRES